MDDLPYFNQNFNDLSVINSVSRPFPRSPEEHENRIKKSWENMKNGTGFEFGITTMDDEFLGTIGLHGNYRINSNAELGIIILNKNNHNKGYGTDALITMCGFGFKFLNLHSIQLRHFDFNKNGRKAYERAGFQDAGRFREQMFRNGKYHDICLMDILAEEWLEKFPHYNLYKPAVP